MAATSKLRSAAPTIVLAFAVVLVAGLLGNAWRQRADDVDEDAPKKAKAVDRAYTADDPAYKSDALPPRRFQAIDVHEHVLDLAHAEKLLPAMDALGIRRTCLMGTTTYTFTLSKKFGYEGWRENDDAILAIKAAHPDRFCAFVTIDPSLPDALDTLKSYVARGADGLKLYMGHGEGTGKGPFHVMPLDDPRMHPIYAYAQSIELPIVYHVNLEKFFDEFERMMKAFPKLRVDVPHFGLHKTTQARLDKLGTLLDTYENVYTDVSFGWLDFHKKGFESLAGNRERTRRFFAAHADKLLFASDMVIEPTKDKSYVWDTPRSYMQLLETEKFRFFMQPDRLMVGLALPDDVLKKVYETSPAAFLRLDAAGNLPVLNAP